MFICYFVVVLFLYASRNVYVNLIVVVTLVKWEMKLFSMVLQKFTLIYKKLKDINVLYAFFIT